MTKIVSIHSFRGGTGKSNITANLAAQLALAGKRVGFADTDFASPGIHVLFGLNEDTVGHTTNEYLRGECTIDEVIFSVGDHPSPEPGCQKLKDKTIWFLPASIKRENISQILAEGYDINLLNKGLVEFRKIKELDYLLLDTHPGIQEETLLALALSDALVLVMRPDQQDFQGTPVVYDIAVDLDVPNVFLVINKVPMKYDFNAVKSDILQHYQPTSGSKVKTGGVFALSEDLAEMGSADIFSLRYPNHEISKELVNLTQAVLSL